MNRTTITSRPTTPRRRYVSGWHLDRGSNAPLARSPRAPHDDGTEQRQQNSAMKVWENEGGSLRGGPHLFE